MLIDYEQLIVDGISDFNIFSTFSTIQMSLLIGPNKRLYLTLHSKETQEMNFHCCSTSKLLQ